MHVKGRQKREQQVTLGHRAASVSSGRREHPQFGHREAHSKHRHVKSFELNSNLLYLLASARVYSEGDLLLIEK